MKYQLYKVLMMDLFHQQRENQGYLIFQKKRFFENRMEKTCYIHILQFIQYLMKRQQKPRLIYESNTDFKLKHYTPFDLAFKKRFSSNAKKPHNMLGANVSFTNLPKPHNRLAQEHSPNTSYNHAKSLKYLKNYELPRNQLFESTKKSEQYEFCSKPDRLQIIPTEAYQIKLRQTNSTKCNSPKAKMMINFQDKIKQYKKLKLLGKGKTGNVYLAVHIKTGFVVALKIMNKVSLYKQDDEKDQIIEQIIRQIKIQSFLEHPNLVKLYDFFADENNIYLIQEVGCDGQLYSLLKSVEQGFTEETTSIAMREIIGGIQHMHKNEVLHRDIKLENVVFSHGLAKICDFGWSVHCPSNFRKTLCGTPLYLSPEILQGKGYSSKVDIWALGALTHELSTNTDPFKIKKHSELGKIVTEDFEMKKGSVDLRNFITFVLRKDPKKRPNAQLMLKHPFISKYADLQTSQEICRITTL